MRFEAGPVPSGSESSSIDSHTEAKDRNITEARIGTMQAELQILEAQYKGLQTLVGELLLTNQKLRAEVADLRKLADPTAPATHPQPRPDR